jgi:aminoglycoside phosphotransferase (APT) family kinase protein
VPGLERGAAPRLVQPLPGGSVNRVYRVDSAAGRFVVRLNGAAWRRPGVDRARELLLHRAAAAAGIAPAIVHAEPAADGLLITEHRDGRVWSPDDFGAAPALVRLGERLQVLHRLHSPTMAPFDPWALAHGYVQSIEALPIPGQREPARTTELAARIAVTLSRLEPCCAALQRAGEGGLCIVHGDLAAGNLLQGERLWLLDWEYAQRGHPVLDLACVLAYYPQAAAHRREFAAAAGLDALARGALLPAAEYIYGALSWLWHLARGEDVPAP